jgi:acetyl esterase/lipase
MISENSDIRLPSREISRLSERNYTFDGQHLFSLPTIALQGSKFLFMLLAFLLPDIVLAQQYPMEIPLWPNGAPGFESRKNEPTQAKDWWMKNIHNPSVTVYPATPEKATGTAVVVCPGGGHRELVITAEGKEAAEFLNSIGVTVFVLKYRLANEDKSPYTLEKHVREDAYRAMRLVRSRAAEWNIDPHKIGMMGFSAGGEVVALVAYGSGDGDPKATDPIDKMNGKPNFQMLVYPGPGFIPKIIPKDAPPLFMLVANDDPCCSESVVTLLQGYRAASIPVEAHIYAQGKHAFNMGNRSKLTSIKTWPQRLADWMSDSGLLIPSQK